LHGVNGVGAGVVVVAAAVVVVSAAVVVVSTAVVVVVSAAVVVVSAAVVVVSAAVVVVGGGVVGQIQAPLSHDVQSAGHCCPQPLQLWISVRTSMQLLSIVPGPQHTNPCP
jgi:hypothetical protein